LAKKKGYEKKIVTDRAIRDRRESYRISESSWKGMLVSYGGRAKTLV
jgi:hypothetical protein